MYELKVVSSKLAPLKECSVVFRQVRSGEQHYVEMNDLREQQELAFNNEGVNNI